MNHSCASAAHCPLAASVRGAAAFGLVSVAVYATVAWGGHWLYRTLTEPGAYAFWTFLYLLGTPWLLGRLLVQPNRRARFSRLFVAGFLAYAVGWIALYFALRGKTGEILGGLVGPALFGAVLCGGFGRWEACPAVVGVLTLGHAAGYFAGDAMNSALAGPLGMVAWGVCHGLGYGAAIGWAMWRVIGTCGSAACWARTTDVPPSP